MKLYNNLLLIILFIIFSNITILNAEEVKKSLDIKREHQEYRLEISGLDKEIVNSIIESISIEKNLLAQYGFSYYRVAYKDKDKILKEIKEFFKNDGYKGTSIKIIKLKSKIIYKVELGTPLIFKSIIIKDENQYEKSKLYKLIKFNLGDRFNITKYKDSISEINNFLLQKNISIPKFSFTITLEESNMLVATLKINVQQSNQRINKIVLHNHTNISDSVIKNQIMLKEGQEYNYQLEQKTYRKLKSLSFFEVVIIEKEIQDKGLKINIYIKKKSKSKYKISLGYNSQDKARVKYQLKTPNISDTLININANIDVSSINQLLDVNYGKRYDNLILYNNIKLSHKKTLRYEYYNLDIAAGNTMSIFDIQVDAFVKHSKNKILYDFLTNKKEDYTTNSMNLIIKKIRLTKDKNNIYYKKGYTFELGIEAAPSFINKEFPFIKYNAEYALLQELFTKNSFWLKMKYKNIYNSSSILLPTPLLIPVGGMLSNRGCNYEEYYTEGLFETNFDLETRVTEDLYIASITDISIFKDVANDNKSEFILSVGMGLHYITPIGIFKLDVAKQMDNKKSDVKYNFGYGYDF